MCVFKCIISVIVSGLEASSAELGGRDRERPGPTVPFPRNVPFQGWAWVRNLVSTLSADKSAACVTIGCRMCVYRQRGLFRVLKAYTQYQPKDGYCQAQGPVAAVLLMNMPAEVATGITVYCV